MYQDGLNTATNTVVATVGVGDRPVAVAFTPDGSRAYVSNVNSNTVSVIDTGPGGSLLSVGPGGRLISTGPGPLIRFNPSTVTLGGPVVELAGRSTATAAEVADGVVLTLGTDRPLQHGGVLVELSGSTLTAQKGVRVDTALLEASAPLLDLKAGTTFTTTAETIDLSLKAKLTSLGPVVRLDASTLNVNRGAAVNVVGGSLLRVTGDLIQLSNGSTLNLLNGPALNVAGASVVNVSGALAAFTAPGGNAINITNSLYPCIVRSGLPVALTGGAVAANVTIGPNPIKNLGTLGTLNLSANAAVIAVSGALSKVTIAAP